MEGQVQFIAVGLGNIVGATILAYGWDHWGIFNILVKGSPEVNLISSLGWSGALIATSAFFVILYLLVVLKEKAYTKKINRKQIPSSKSTTA
jgi:uncharacterized membrane protein YedE/YeeE